MKILGWSLALFLIFGGLGTDASFAQAGWHRQNPRSWDSDPLAVTQPDPKTVVVVGSAGAIARSTGGE
jgi:hypothetical protein